MLHFERLQALHAVSTFGSVTGAAAALRLTPSAVSQQLSKLQRDVGQRLIEPYGRGVRLTPAGAFWQPGRTPSCPKSRTPKASWIGSAPTSSVIWRLPDSPLLRVRSFPRPWHGCEKNISSSHFGSPSGSRTRRSAWLLPGISTLPWSMTG